jgi:hypothetical protein
MINFDWYNAALANPSKIGTRELPVHENEPQPGYYRSRDGKPVYIISNEHGDTKAVIGTEDDFKVDDAFAIWTWVCRHPVDFDVWKVAYGGAPWPDDPGLGHNRPTEIEALTDEIDTATRSAKEWLAGAGNPAEWDQTKRDLCQNYRDRIAKLEKTADDKRKELKRPHLDANTAIEAEWSPIIEKCETTHYILGLNLTDAQRAERDRRRAEAAEIARKAEETRQKDGPQAAAEVYQTLPSLAVKAGTMGRKSGLKTVTTYPIVDISAVLAYLATRTDTGDALRSAVQVEVNRLWKAGVAVPGSVEKKEEKAT